MKNATPKKNKAGEITWVRLDALVTPAQYDLVVKVSEIEYLSKAEVTRIMIEIAAYVLMGNLDKASRRAASLPYPLTPEMIQEYVR